MGAGAAEKVFVVCQPENVSIPSGRGKVPRLHCLSSWHLNGRETNQGYT